jgi:hypothetical protein
MSGAPSLEVRIMTRELVTSATVLILAMGLAACSDSTQSSKDSGYLGTADAPLVAPTNPYATSGSTQQKQENSGYFPNAGAPLTTPTNPYTTSGSTQEKQENSGYFPEAGAPLVAPTTTGTH